MQMCVRSKQQHTSPEMLIYNLSEKLYFNKRGKHLNYTSVADLGFHKGGVHKVRRACVSPNFLKPRPLPAKNMSSFVIEQYQV